MSATKNEDFPPLQTANGKTGHSRAHPHNYAASPEEAMDTAKPGNGKGATGTRRPLNPTPTKLPPAKKSNTVTECSFADLVAVIQKLEIKVDAVGEQMTANAEQLRRNSEQLQRNSELVSDCIKRLDDNTVQIVEIKSKVEVLEKENEKMKKENSQLRETVLEVERYKRRWNLRLSGLKEEEGENIRAKIEELLLQLFPQWAANIGNIVDSVHRVGPKVHGRSRQVIMQFVMRIHRDAVWKSTKGSPICRERGVRFVEDFTKEDRLARELLWPKIKLARAQNKVAYYRGHVAVIDGHVVTA